MNKQGPIILIDDDVDDLESFTEVIMGITKVHEVIPFSNSDAALTYLTDNSDVNPFLILSDINLPKLSGIELRDKIRNNEEIRLRCIPYLFFTTAIGQKDLIDAYSKSIQGFFIKPSDYNELKDIMKAIITYWGFCKAPNYVA